MFSIDRIQIISIFLFLLLFAWRLEMNGTSEVTSKPRLYIGQVRKYLANVPEEYVFWTHDGNNLRDMKDLKDALANMSDEIFYYHSNEYKKDFSNWVRDIIGDETLAHDLEIAANREQASRIVSERYNYLASKLA